CLAVAAGGQQGYTGEDGDDLAGMLVEGVDAIAFAVGRGFGDEETEVGLRDQIEDEPMFADLDILLFTHRLQQGTFDLFSGHVLVMEDAEFGVTAFAAQLEISFRIPVEAGPPFDDLADTFGSFLYDDLDGVRAAE